MRELVLFTVVIISIPFVLKKPNWALLIYLGFNIIRPEIIFWGTTQGSLVFRIYYFLLLISILMNFSQFDLKGIFSNKTIVWMIWLVASIFLSLFLSEYYISEYEFYYAFEMLKILGILIAIYIIFDSIQDVSRFQIIMIFLFLIMSIVGIQQNLSGSERLEGLLGTSWGDSNGIAAIFVLMSTVPLGLFFSNDRLKWLYLVGFLLICIVIVCTQSRGGIIGLGVALMSFGLYSNRLGKTIFLGLIALAFMWPFVSTTYIERFQPMKSIDSLDISARSRFLLWEAGILVFKDNPVIGTGFLTYPTAKLAYENEIKSEDSEVMSLVFDPVRKLVTHNAYIQAISDLGILGGLPFVLIVSTGITIGLKVRKDLRSANEYESYLFQVVGISSGITGFAICVITIDAILCSFLYYQAISSTILYKKIIENYSI